MRAWCSRLLIVCLLFGCGSDVETPQFQNTLEPCATVDRACSDDYQCFLNQCMKSSCVDGLCVDYAIVDRVGESCQAHTFTGSEHLLGECRMCDGCYVEE